MKHRTLWGLAILALALMFTIGCDSPAAPTPAPTPAPVVQAEAPEEALPQAVPTPAPDLSDGKGITASFDAAWNLTVKSTNAGHANSGLVCLTNGFQGPVIGSYRWSVSPQSTSVTPFKPAVLSLDWKEDECERDIRIQADAIRGDDCSSMGHILAVVWPADPGNPYTVTREGCGECVEAASISIATECGEWNACHEHPEQGCFRERECVETTTTDYLCQADTQTVRTYEEPEPCECVCVDEPSGSLVTITTADPYVAQASFEDSGEWKLRIHASSAESECLANDPDWWKRTVTKTLLCDEQGTLEASFSWAGHGAEWWRTILTRDGVVVDQSDCVRNPFN